MFVGSEGGGGDESGGWRAVSVVFVWWDFGLVIRVEFCNFGFGYWWFMELLIDNGVWWNIGDDPPRGILLLDSDIRLGSQCMA